MSTIITVKATSITVSNGLLVMDLLQPLFNLCTYEDEYVEETKTLGFLYDEETDTIYLHKGVDINYLVKLLGNDCEIRYDLYDEYRDMEFEYEEVIAPRSDEQVDVINFICGQQDHASNIDASQIFLVLGTGKGKAQPYSSRIPTPMMRKNTAATMDFIGKDFKPELKRVTYEECMNYITMGELQIGDTIFDRHGRPTKILNIFEQGERDVYKLTFEDGRTALCDYEHLWPVFVGDKDKWSSYFTYEILEMLNNDISVFIPLCGPVHYPYHSWGHGLTMEDTDSLSYKYNSPNKMEIFLKQYGFTESEGNVKLIDDSWEDKGKEHRINFIKNTVLPILYAMGYIAYLKEDGVVYYRKDKKLRIVHIDYSHREQSRCIMVDNPEHLYLTDDYIVTHNTYCSGVGLCKYATKTLIIMHRDTLRSQWVNSLYKMNGLNSSYVHEIESSEELYEIATGEYKPNYDVYLMTHATFRAGLKRIRSMKTAMNIGKNLGIGLKIIDEAHLEFKDTILIDMIFNVKRNLYLTATDGRSSKDENSIFRHVFSNCVYYKPSAMLTDNRPKKWVNYYGVEVNTNLNKNIYRYRVVGSKSMTPASYGQWVIKRDKTKQHFKCCRDIVKMLFKEDQYAKLIIFMPLIDLCEECAYFLTMELQKDPEFPYDVDIRTINSKNSKKDNELAKRSDIIVTTIGSCGTGTDIPGITGIIACSPFVSKITASQVFGRLRYCGKICSYYDIWDSSVPMDKYWYQSRSKTIGHLALNVRELSWSDDTSNEQQP